MEVKPGDLLDGKVGIEAAANTLLQAVFLQANARNSTLSVIGAMDKSEGVKDEVWEDWFVQLDGPEFWRRSIVEGSEHKFEQLAGYMREWSERFDNGAKE
eukprot:860238_1